MGQTVRSAPVSPWHSLHEGVRVVKLKCERSGHGDRRFRAYCITNIGDKEKQAVLRAFDAEQDFGSWYDFKTMPTDQEYIFPEDDQPRAIINYRKSENHELTNVQPDYEHRQAVVRDMMIPHELGGKYNTTENRRTINELPTLVDVILWAKQYIEANKKTGKQELDEHFGEKQPPHWIDNKKERGMFWGDIHACGNQYEAWKELSVDETNEYVHKAIGSRLHETTLTRPEATKIVIDKINADYGGDTVTDQPTPTTVIEPPTKEQWVAWLNENQLSREYVVSLMNADSIERGEGPVQGLTQWDKDIPAAMALVEKDRAAKAEKAKSNEKATNFNDSDKTPPTVPNQPQPQKSVPQSPTTNGKQSETPKPTLSIQKAVKRDLKLRLALAGVPGGGKTYTALQIASAMFPDGKIAVIDTENRNSLKYADLFNFDYIDIGAPYTPERYIEGIKLVEEAGYDILILDSLSHAWKEAGGILDWVDQAKGNAKYQTKSGKENTQAIWAEATPRHNAMVNAILNSNLHIIATLRAKYREVAVRNEKQEIIGTRKIITDFVQRDGLPYEFDIIAKLQDPDIARIDIDKTRCPKLVKFSKERAGVELGKILIDWLKDDPSVLATAS